MENSFSIANFFIKKSIEESNSITPMKLLKLVYLSHGWYMGFYSDRLIPDEAEAWRYGPVIPKLYHEIKKFGLEDIVAQLKDENTEGNPIYQIPSTTKEVELLNAIWEHYGSMSALDLSTITHISCSPWDTIWNLNGGNIHYGAIIPADLIRKYYQQKIVDGRISIAKQDLNLKDYIN